MIKCKECTWWGSIYTVLYSIPVWFVKFPFLPTIRILRSVLWIVIPIGSVSATFWIRIPNTDPVSQRTRKIQPTDKINILNCSTVDTFYGKLGWMKNSLHFKINNVKGLDPSSNWGIFQDPDLKSNIFRRSTTLALVMITYLARTVTGNVLNKRSYVEEPAP